VTTPSTSRGDCSAPAKAFYGGDRFEFGQLWPAGHGRVRRLDGGTATATVQGACPRRSGEGF
jgi:hypothetical protein